MADELDRANARLPLERLLPCEDCHPRAEVGVILKIQCDLARAVAIEAGKTILNIGCITDLGCFAIADNIDAGFNLLSYGLRHAFGHDAIEFASIVLRTLFALE